MRVVHLPQGIFIRFMSYKSSAIDEPCHQLSEVTTPWTADDDVNTVFFDTVTHDIGCQATLFAA